MLEILGITFTIIKWLIGLVLVPVVIGVVIWLLVLVVGIVITIIFTPFTLVAYLVDTVPKLPKLIKRKLKRKLKTKLWLYPTYIIGTTILLEVVDRFGNNTYPFGLGSPWGVVLILITEAYYWDDENFLI